MTAPEIRIMPDGRVERRWTGTEFFSPFHPVTMEPWTQATALAFTVEDEEQWGIDYAAAIQAQLIAPPPASTNAYRERLIDLTMTGATVEHLLNVDSIFNGLSMVVTTPVVTDGPNTFDVFIQVGGVDTLIGTQATQRVAKAVELPAGSNPKLVFVPSGVGATEFLSGAVRIRTHWFQPFVLTA